MYGVSWWLSFIFFACSCPDLSTPFVEEAIFTTFYASALFFQIVIDCTDLGLFLGSLLCPLVYVSVFMPVPGCFDYSGFVIEFDIRYYDPSYFVLLSQNCHGYSGSFMVLYGNKTCRHCASQT